MCHYVMLNVIAAVHGCIRLTFISFATGLMHYKLDDSDYSLLPPATPDAAKPLFVEKNSNCVLNESGIYLLDELHTIQNLSSLKLAETNRKLKSSNQKGMSSLSSNGLHLFESVDCLYGNSDFYVSPFYRADDPRVIAKIDEQHEYNRKRHSRIS